MAEGYKVLSIDELTRLSDTGGIERYYRHKIKSTGGVVLTVDISQKDFTDKLAAPILLKAAQNADKILAL